MHEVHANPQGKLLQRNRVHLQITRKEYNGAMHVSFIPTIVKGVDEHGARKLKSAGPAARLLEIEQVIYARLVVGQKDVLVAVVSVQEGVKRKIRIFRREGILFHESLFARNRLSNERVDGILRAVRFKHHVNLRNLQAEPVFVPQQKRLNGFLHIFSDFVHLCQLRGERLASRVCKLRNAHRLTREERKQAIPVSIEEESRPPEPILYGRKNRNVMARKKFFRVFDLMHHLAQFVTVLFQKKFLPINPQRKVLTQMASGHHHHLVCGRQPKKLRQ